VSLTSPCLKVKGFYTQLDKFMGGRYAYNDRIVTNEIHILKLCYFNLLKAGDNWKKKELMEIED
jgi:hypothetical protein